MSGDALSGDCLQVLWQEFVSKMDHSLKIFLQEQCSFGSLDENTLTIVTPNVLARDYLKKQNNLEQIERNIRDTFNNNSIKVEFVTSLDRTTEKKEKHNSTSKKNSTSEAIKWIPDLFSDTEEEVVSDITINVTKDVREESQYQTNLQKDLLFKNFVGGRNNDMARTAALSVAQSPGVAYNPLFIYSGVGLGKTHLINAIGNYVREHYPSLKVLYVSTEQFTNEFVESIRLNKQQSFRNKFREVDVLLIDDIHFILNKDGFQEELFQTIDFLRRNKRQVVISSDCPPSEMKTVINRLKSRFSWGLIVDIQKPNLETRIAILKQKIEDLHINIDDDEVLNYIATQFHSNIRVLEGALLKVTTYCDIFKKPISLTYTKEALKDLLKNESNSDLTVEDVIDVTCEYFSISKEDLIGSRRDQKIARARQVAMYLCKELIKGISYLEIGSYFGDRTHSTVINACHKVEDNVNESFYKMLIHNLKENLKKS
ncbi:chromosomal replication initiator protein DnaA [bacterium]|nr:chromosomal replication initiator protein DnaA [bacterium]